MPGPWAQDDPVVIAAKLSALAAHRDNVWRGQQACFDRLLWNLDLQVCADLPENKNNRDIFLAVCLLAKSVNWKDVKIRIRNAALACAQRFLSDLQDLVEKSSSILRRDIAFLVKNPRDGHLDALEKSVQELTCAIKAISKRLKVSEPSLIGWGNDPSFFRSANEICVLTLEPLVWLDELLAARLAGHRKPGRPKQHAVSARDARLRQLAAINPKLKNADLADVANSDDVIEALGFTGKISQQTIKDLTRKRGAKKRKTE